MSSCSASSSMTSSLRMVVLYLLVVLDVAEGSSSLGGTADGVSELAADAEEALGSNDTVT